MPIQQITPRQFFKIRKEKVLFSISICFLLISLASLIVFLANIKSETTNAGQKIYSKNSKIPLYVSFSFSILTLSLFSSIIVAYNKIFSLEKSPTLTICFILTGLSLIILLIDIILLVKNFNLCPDGKEYNKDADQCVPICPPNYYLDTNLLCARGCQTSSDCDDNHVCIDGNCCDLDKNQVIDGICCPKNCVHQQDGEAPFCCSQPLCEGNGKKICCNEDSLKCEISTDSGDPYCAIKCGTEDDSPVCGEGEYCLSYPASLDEPNDSSKTGKTYKCSGGPKTCSKAGGTFYYPTSIGNFYPAYNNIITKPPDLDQFLDNIPNTDDYNAVISAYTDDGNNQNQGYISGLQNAIQFQTDEYSNNCNIETCLTNVQYPYTKQLNVVQGGNNIYCNQYKTFEKDISSASNEDDSYYTSETVEDNGNGIFRLKSEPKNFSTGAPQTPTGNKLNDDTVCGDQNYYSSDSSKFDSCGSDGSCPFPQDESSPYECPNEDNVRFIQEKASTKETKCLAKDSMFQCVEVEKGEYPDAQNCSETQNCIDSVPRENDFKMKFACVTGEDSKWAESNPSAGSAEYHFDSYPDNNKDGYCDLKTEIADKIGTDESPCPPGTKPYFWASKSDPDNKKGCNGVYNAYYTRLDYVCCSENAFTLTDEESQWDYYSDKPPTNINYCFGSNAAMPASQDNKFSPIYNNDPDIKTLYNLTSVILGRGYPGHVALHGSNTCNVDASDGFNMVRKVLGNMNQNVWNPQNEKG
jgi:hypothetical protein